jgi:hypothetical protein
MRWLPVLLAAAAIAAASAACAAPPAAFQRCAVCHLATGEGVPGAFPPLAGRVREIAGTPEGRRYLVSVPSSGLSGDISVGGVTYRGYMPQQNGLSAEDLAGILNYLGVDLGKGGPGSRFRSFTGPEVDQIRKANAGQTPTDVAKLRARAVPATGKR